MVGDGRTRGIRPPLLQGAHRIKDPLPRGAQRFGQRISRSDQPLPTGFGPEIGEDGRRKASPIRRGCAWSWATRSFPDIEGLTKAHGGQPVLSGLSHRFSPSGLHLVSGPSGSGKTTLLDLICGLDAPDGGRLLIDGRSLPVGDPEGLAEWRRACLGYVSQHATLTDTLSAAENVALGPALHGATAERSAEAAGQWLDWVGLAAMSRRRSDRLSGGEQRRVALARAMASSPPLLVIDEPTAHLDRVSGRRILSLLKQAAQAGATVIASSHDPDALEIADQILELDKAASTAAKRA